MRHRTVEDVMTHQVATVRRDTPFKEVAELLDDRAVSAVPVVDDARRLIGLVSEADLLRLESARPDPDDRGGPVRRTPGRRAQAETAGELMTTPVHTARPDWSVVEAARLMDRHHIKRLPVVDGTGRVVGIVSRSDLLRIFLRQDRAIREEIQFELLERTLFLPPGAVRVEVEDGVVTLRGRVERRSTVPLVQRLCTATDGVVAVHAQLDWDFDDQAEPVEPPAVRGVFTPRRRS